MPDHFPNSHYTIRSRWLETHTHTQDMQRVRIETAHTHTHYTAGSAHKTRCFVCFRALRVISAPPPHRRRRRAADYAHRRICVSLSLSLSHSLWASEALYLFCTHGVALWLRAVVINGESGINYTAEYVPCNNHEPTRSAQRRLGPAACMHLKRSAARAHTHPTLCLRIFWDVNICMVKPEVFVTQPRLFAQVQKG